MLTMFMGVIGGISMKNEDILIQIVEETDWVLFYRRKCSEYKQLEKIHKKKLSKLKKKFKTNKM